jgi:HK97 family phage major capsid protein
MTSAAPRHENEVRLANILSEIKSATDSLEARDRRVRALEGTVNDLMRRMGRPSGGNGLGETDERSQAIGLLEQKHFATVTKRDALLPEPNFSEEQIAEAKLAIRGVRTLMHSTSIDQVPLDQRKALSAFSFGAQGFLLAPEISSQILSCLESVTDIAALMQNINISGASIKFLTDNETWDVAAWACEASCFANNPTQQLGSGLGELEIKPESLRYIVCATRDLLEDSSVAIEPWLLSKASRAFGLQISNAVLAGDGFGKPMGILNPAAGIPICETSDASPPGVFDAL